MFAPPRHLAVLPETKFRFVGPFTTPKHATLLLVNTSKYKIAYKVKTTAPHIFILNPEAGFVAFGQQTEVQILMRPLNHDELVQAESSEFKVIAYPAANEDTDAVRYWQEKRFRPRKLQEKDIAVTFEAAYQAHSDSPTGKPMTVEKGVQASVMEEMRTMGVGPIQEWMKRLEQERFSLLMVLEEKLGLVSSNETDNDTGSAAERLSSISSDDDDGPREVYFEKTEIYNKMYKRTTYTTPTQNGHVAGMDLETLHI